MAGVCLLTKVPVQAVKIPSELIWSSLPIYRIFPNSTQANDVVGGDGGIGRPRDADSFPALFKIGEEVACSLREDDNFEVMDIPQGYNYFC
jgi:hypothetical protein